MTQAIADRNREQSHADAGSALASGQPFVEDPPDMDGPNRTTGDYSIEPGAFSVARQHRGSEAPAEGAGWTVCPAPTRLAVIDADGGIRACEYGAVPLGSVERQPVAEAWIGSEFQKLRAALAEGRLPGAHCGGCIRLCAAGRVGFAPLMREYGGAGSGPPGLRTFAVRLPDGGGALSPGVRLAFKNELAGIERLSLECADTFGTGSWLEALASIRAALANRPLIAR